MVNPANFTALPIAFNEPSGLIVLAVGAVVVVAAFYIFFRIIKDVIANAIIGGIGLIVLHFAGPHIGVSVPIDLINIVIAILGGLPGLAIIVVFSALGL
ncbi:MAG: pro-sigmaK processing inhibitor BofA family protein [Candidatus Diapherotrites archaeon]|nr:pro-sigmaK processing inhibitor BofA family protein [Candidatus Diapherotrites archaeon]